MKDKYTIQQLAYWTMPVGLFLFYFAFYNFGKFSPSEMVKTTGLMAISLLSITLAVGPVARFIPSINSLKTYRKFWGITSFVFLLAHLGLVLIFYFKFNLLRLFVLDNSKFPGLAAGMLAFAVLLVVTLTSNKKIVKRMNPRTWKIIQTTSYVALLLSVTHFYLMEQVGGVLVIKRLLGRVTFLLAIGTILIRILVLVFPQKRK